MKRKTTLRSRIIKLKPMEDGSKTTVTETHQTRKNREFLEMAGRGLEPRTHGFSVHCSTN
jgi:hypothetical protein